MRLVNPCEGTNGTTVTAANSDDNGGAAFNTVQTGASWTHVYDTSVFHYGTSSIRQNGGSASQCHDTWDISPSVNRMQGAASFRLASVSVARSLIQGRAGGTQRWRIAFLSTGRIEFNNISNTTLGTTAGTFSANTFYRIRYDITVGTSGAYSVSFYDSSDNLIETLSGTGDFGTANFDEVRHGQIANATGLGNLFWDGLIATDEGIPGAWIGSASLTAAALAFNAVPLAPTPGAVTVNLTPGVVTFSPVALSPAPQPVQVSLTPAVVSILGVPLNPIPQPVTVALAPAQLAFSALGLNPQPQPVTVTLTPAGITFAAVPLSPEGDAGPSFVDLVPAVINFAATALTPVPQPVTVNLAPAGLTFTAVALSPTPGQVTVVLTPAQLSLVAVALDPQGVGAPAEFSGVWGIEAGI
jgi:hypothetical protein